MKATKRNVSLRSRKRMGAHYTPPLLARLVADKLVERIEKGPERTIRWLDPACGVGELLLAGIDAMRHAGLAGWEVVGVEAEPVALRQAAERLQHLGPGSIRLIPGDFLDLVSAFQPQKQLWMAGGAGAHLGGFFDVVIANPPYVRTQVLGAARARKLAAQFGLSGRVDLYHAFVRAIGITLRQGGFLGIITSNRFMTTLAGKAMRRFLTDHFELLEVLDLGDTKLFEAAVLPAVVIARRRSTTQTFRVYSVPFVRVYSEPEAAAGPFCPPPSDRSIVEALAQAAEGCVHVREGRFAITRGSFPVTAGCDQLWGLISPEERGFLDAVRKGSACTVGDLAFVRVGIKTTADEVFLRDDWARLPAAQKPEDDLLRPVLCHEDVQPWAIPGDYVPSRQVLYPHRVANGRKVAVPLAHYPRCQSYLERFRARLEQRHYVREAGRAWYELWVPQDPAAWDMPKLVFPDISPEPRFCFVDRSFVINGDCYWLLLKPGVPPAWLYLILAVANSRLMARFHDASFGNKLYAGRRRYITQYVSKYPLPAYHSPVVREIIQLTKQIIRRLQQGASLDSCMPDISAVQALIPKAYGIRRDEVPP